MRSYFHCLILKETRNNDSIDLKYGIKVDQIIGTAGHIRLKKCLKKTPKKASNISTKAFISNKKTYKNNEF